MGAWSPSLDGDLDPVTVVEWVGFVCAWNINRACVLGYPARIHWFANRRESSMTCLQSSNVVRTGI